MKAKLRKIALAVVIVAGLAAIGVVGYKLYEQSQQPLRADVALVNRGVAALIDEDDEQLAAVASEIQAISDHELVPEYSYLLARHFAGQNDEDKTVRYIEAFRAATTTEYAGEMRNMRTTEMQTQLDRELENLRVRLTPRDIEMEPTWAD